MEREVPFSFNSQQELTLNMQIADFSTTQQVVERLNKSMGGQYASAPDISTIRIRVPSAYQGNLVPLLATVENLEVTPENRAKVVVDEKTGTIVIGRDVRIARVAVAHGNLQVTVQESAQVSQPGPFSNGTTVVTPATDIETLIFFSSLRLLIKFLAFELSEEYIQLYRVPKRLSILN